MNLGVYGSRRFVECPGQTPCLVGEPGLASSASRRPALWQSSLAKQLSPHKQPPSFPTSSGGLCHFYYLDEESVKLLIRIFHQPEKTTPGAQRVAAICDRGSATRDIGVGSDVRSGLRQTQDRRQIGLNSSFSDFPIDADSLSIKRAWKPGAQLRATVDSSQSSWAFGGTCLALRFQSCRRDEPVHSTLDENA